MRLLFCNVAYRGRSGTETYLADLVPALRARGHQVACLTTPTYPIDTGVGRDLIAQGITVAQDPAAIGWEPELIHGHHREPTALAIAAWPRTPAIFFVHDALAPTDAPLREPSIARWVAVDHLCAGRLAELPAERCDVIYNAVNLARFSIARRPPTTPRRALLFMGHAPDYGFVGILEQACAARGVTLERLTLAEHEEPAPEHHLGCYDLAFARGRSAIEAIASGLGLICCGSEGLGPLVTSATFDDARRYNFGRGLLTVPHAVDGVTERIDRWDPDDIAAVTHRLRAEASLDDLVAQLEALYRRVLAEAPTR